MTASKRWIVSIVRYEKPYGSVRKAVDLCRGLDGLPANGTVFIKPNVVYWTRFTNFPKWGTITTSRIVEDMVILLKERGIEKVVIGEGMVSFDPKDKETTAHAFESLGYNRLKKRMGVEVINAFERPFEKIELGGDLSLKFNSDFINSDFVVDIPVLKTHAQTVVSLGIKNLKGMLDLDSRKRCHSADPLKDLNYMIAKLHEAMPPCLTVLDGIYTNERGPSFDGKIRRKNILVASSDILSADKVGAKVLGYEPSDVPHLAHAARNAERPEDMSDVEIVGERIEDVASLHKYEFPYADGGSLPLPMKRMGVKGLSYRKYDLSMCTYCSILNGSILSGIAEVWNGKSWDDVEVLTGKSMKPTPGKKKTILIGKCIVQANKEDPNINEMIRVDGCPPSTDSVVKAFNQAGIPLSHKVFERMDVAPGLFMKKYEGKAEFDEGLFRVD